MDFTFKTLNSTRGVFNKIIENHTLQDLNKIPKGFNNNVIWNIGHVLVTEQLLVYKLSGLETNLSENIINTYKKDSKPKGDVSKKEVNEIKDLLFSTIEKTKSDYQNGVFKIFNEYTVSTTGNTLTNIEDALQFVVLHEGLHFGYILALLRVI